MEFNSQNQNKPLTIQQELNRIDNQSADEPETVFIGGFPPKTTEG